MRETIRKPTGAGKAGLRQAAAAPRAQPDRPLDAASMLDLQRTVGNRAALHAVGSVLQVARTPAKPGPVVRGAGFAGVALGTNSAGKPVKAVREVGGSQGYDDRLQAISVARLAKAEPAAVVLAADEKWHALETSVAFEVGPVSAVAKTAAFSKVHGLPLLAGLAAVEKQVTDLMAKLGRLDGLENEYKTDPEFRRAVKGSNIPIPEAIEAERQKTRTWLAQAKQTRAAVILGVAESEINFIRSVTSGRTAHQVNVVETHIKGTPGGGHSPLGGGLEFQERLGSALSLDQPELDNPGRAQAVLFHEAQHRSDWDFAQAWIAKYRSATGRQWVKGQPGRKPFEDWLNEQVKLRRLSKADVELVVMQTLDSSAYTEARANVRSFLAALQTGDADGARRELVGYAHALKPKKDGGGGQYSSPAPGSEVQKALVAELKGAYAKMTVVMQRQYDAIVVAAVAENPSAWITQLRIGKRR
ncbi:MAG: hypothetical protein ABWZ02_01730 [Nakamurella sp.]